MRTTEKKLFFVNQHEQEEEWLNYMSSKGKAMLCYKFPCFYEFEECEPGEYIYRIEMLENWPSSTESRQYIEFLEDMGIEMTGFYMRWVYFRKKAKDGPFDLFSDLESKIKHYKRIFWFIFPVFILEIIIAATNLISGLASGYSYPWSTTFLLVFLALVLGYFELSLLQKISTLKKEHLVRE